LEEVAAGESIEITDRGRPVARLVPITGDPWQDLISAGEVVKAGRRLSAEDIKPAAYPHSGSGALDQLRSEER
jgi:antitoxin (DNA-binding transcriptional repressor) of toxin-antitoxin stability system